METKDSIIEIDVFKKATEILSKTTEIFEEVDYSMTVVRSIIAFDVYIDGIMEKKLKEKFREEKIVALILKTFSQQDKFDILMKESYGFSLKEIYPKEITRLEKVRRERNDIVHRGIFSRKSSAKEAMDTVEELIRKTEKRIRGGN